MKNFAITGVAGYIAPRHLKAINDTGNKLVAAVDPHDSVGILDQYFPDTAFFTEIERFDRHLEMLRRNSPNNKVDYLTICSPNHLHDAHIRLALRLDADAICEKPLVLNPWNLDNLEELESETGRRVYTILQIRVHPSIVKLKDSISNELKNNPDKRYSVTLNNVTSRGLWYDYSWKGDIQKSGGIATNIGIHFFDLLIHLFGNVRSSKVFISEKNKMTGFIEFRNADVNWFLSIDKKDIPEGVKTNGKTSYRSIKVDGEEIEFTAGFTDLHTEVYKRILEGKGFGISDARSSIELVHSIRNAKVVAKK